MNPDTGSCVRACLRIRGHVQGVCYRLCAREEAQRLGLAGWVRNLPDGSVEAVAEGPAAAVESFIDWCRRGPARAQVQSVKIDRQPATGELVAFAIR